MVPPNKPYNKTDLWLTARIQNKRHNVLNVRICSTIKSNAIGKKKIIKIGSTGNVKNPLLFDKPKKRPFTKHILCPWSSSIRKWADGTQTLMHRLRKKWQLAAQHKNTFYSTVLNSHTLQLVNLTGPSNISCYITFLKQVKFTQNNSYSFIREI